jgi:DNA-binding CsgD family transcriptional regulator
MRIKIFQLLYITLVTTALTYGVSILRLADDWPAYLLFNISGTLLILTFFAFATAIVARYPRRPAILAFLIFCGGIGNILGNMTGTAISHFLNGNPGLFYGLPVVIFVTAFTMIPLLFRSVKEEADLDNEPGTQAGPRPAEPDVQVISDRFIALNDHFDKENQLTNREREIAALLVERYDYETISNRLFLSVNTIKVHIKNIYRKYDITSRKELIDFVRQKERAGA